MAFSLPFVKVLPAVGPLPSLTLGPDGPVLAASLPYSHSKSLGGISSVDRGMFWPVTAAAEQQWGVKDSKGRPAQIYAEGARADSFGFVDGIGLRPKQPIDGTVWI